jgi:hypothetical protein
LTEESPPPLIFFCRGEIFFSSPISRVLDETPITKDRLIREKHINAFNVYLYYIRPFRDEDLEKQGTLYFYSWSCRCMRDDKGV